MEIELTFNDKNILKVTGGGTKGDTNPHLATTYAEVNHAFSNIVLAVDTVVSISPKLKWESDAKSVASVCA
jgi:hypothetical protein